MAQMTIVEALRQAIREEMQRDPRVCCIGGSRSTWLLRRCRRPSSRTIA